MNISKELSLFWTYYRDAISRSFWAGWNWAIGQGLLLTVLLAMGAVVSGTLFALYRIYTKGQNWVQVRNTLKEAMLDFLIACVGSIVIALCFLFMVFFVMDAPEQLAEAHRKITELTKPPFDIPAGPKAGPIGPILGVEFLLLLENMPKPCALKISGPIDNANLRDTLRWIATEGARCEIDSSADIRDADNPSDYPEPSKESGIIIHWSQDNAFGERVYTFFDRSLFKVSVSHRLPKIYSLWIDIGPGSPWK